MGKDWAKGLTKATDARIARNAAAHVGLRYTSHLPPELDRRRRTSGGPVDTTWTPTLAYAVGLIATDGNLSPNHKSTNVVSADIDLLEGFKRCIPRAGRIGRHGPNSWHVTVSSVDFYRWLQSIGLTPAKSLTLGGLDVPDTVFIDLTRGLMDGDGSLENFIHHPGGNEGMGGLSRAASDKLIAETPEWRNWQSRWIQDPLGRKAREGSSPSSGTD